MILKFYSYRDTDGREFERLIETQDFHVARHYDPEKGGANKIEITVTTKPDTEGMVKSRIELFFLTNVPGSDWDQCFVMNDEGRTVDKYMPSAEPASPDTEEQT